MITAWGVSGMGSMGTTGRRDTPSRVARRKTSAGLLQLLVLGALAAACAEKTPAPKTVAAAPAAAPPAAGGVPSGPPVEIMPAAAARAYLLSSISVGSIDRLLENGTKLASQAV